MMKPKKKGGEVMAKVFDNFVYSPLQLQRLWQGKNKNRVMPPSQ